MISTLQRPIPVLCGQALHFKYVTDQQHTFRCKEQFCGWWFFSSSELADSVPFSSEGSASQQSLVGGLDGHERQPRVRKNTQMWSSMIIPSHKCYAYQFSSLTLFRFFLRQKSHAVQAGFKLTLLLGCPQTPDPPTSAFQVLALQAWAATLCSLHFKYLQRHGPSQSTAAVGVAGGNIQKEFSNIVFVLLPRLFPGRNDVLTSIKQCTNHKTEEYWWDGIKWQEDEDKDCVIVLEDWCRLSLGK